MALSWSQIQTHHEVVTLHVEALILNSHGGGEKEVMANLSFFGFE